MNYEHFEHKADIGIRGFGKTIEEAFANGAKAMFTIMCNLEKVEEKKEIDIKVNSEAQDELFVEFLNELISLSEIESMMFKSYKIKIEKKDKYYLTGKAIGEKTDIKKHQLKTQTKAATFSCLKVAKENEKWVAQCIIDV